MNNLSKHAVRYFIIGVSITIFNFLLYSIIANYIIKNNDLLWLSSFISTFFTTILAYFLHSRITWKDRDVTKVAVAKFFIWNGILTFAINPGLTQLFSLDFVTPLYNLATNIANRLLNLGVNFEFVQSTGAFIITGFVVMIINFLFYDKFVFDKEKTTKPEKKEEEEK